MRRSGIKVMGSLIGLVKPLTAYMILAILLGTIGNLTAIAIPVLGAMGIVDSGKIGMIVELLVVCGIGRGVFRYGEQVCNHYIAFKLLAIIRHKIFVKLRELAPAKLEGKEKGNLVAMVTSDIELLEVFYAHTISPIAIAVITSGIMIGFIGRQHWILGMIAAGGYLIVGCVIPLFLKGDGGEIGYQYRQRLGSMNSFFLDSIRGLPEIIQYGIGAKRLDQLSARTDEAECFNKQLKEKEGNNRAVTDIAILGISAVMLFTASWLAMNHQISFSAVLLTFIAMISSFGPVVALSSLSNNLYQTIASGNRVLDLLEEEPLLNEIAGLKVSGFGDIEAGKIRFGYDQNVVLDKFDLSVKPGQIVGIHGKSGSGKSTLLKLLMRFFQPDAGEIKINQRSLEQINTKDLRDMQSYVTQETCLFHDTIRENIRIAKADASDEAVIEAAKKASIHDFIAGLPKGYDTNIGELGDHLSGGEKQRIGVARAFLHDAPFMLLDEPTSNLDSLNEGIILKSMKEFKENRTILIVSHRKSTMGITDAVIKVENGS